MVQSSAAVGTHVHRRALLRHEAKATVTVESLEIETKGAPEFHDSLTTSAPSSPSPASPTAR